MSDLGRGRRLLLEDFVQENVHSEAGAIFGNLFGALHGQTFKIKQDIVSSQKWKKWVIKNVIKENWVKAIKKHVSREKVEKFLTRADRAEKSIIWFDSVYRNIFIKNRSIALFDFDLSMKNDPAIDIGVFLSHWVWMMLKEDSQLNKVSQKFIKNFISGYEKTFKKNLNNNKKELQKILERSIGWLAMYLISRTDGKSGSYFKHDVLWEGKIRNTAIDLFIDNKKDINVKIIKNLILRQYE
jgi:thiamine kinase-like enzyme